MDRLYVFQSIDAHLHHWLGRAVAPDSARVPPRVRLRGQPADHHCLQSRDRRRGI